MWKFKRSKQESIKKKYREKSQELVFVEFTAWKIEKNSNEQTSNNLLNKIKPFAVCVYVGCCFH